MALRNQPYIPLYVQDFLTDEKLIECSAKATGVYIRLMCIMHKSEEYGKIILKAKYKQNENIINNFTIMLSRQMPYTEEEIGSGLTELLDNRVVYIDNDELCQKRMIKDGELSDKRAIAGSKGGKNVKNSHTKRLYNEPGYLYLFADKDKENIFKIGISKNPDKRLLQIQNKTGKSMEVVYIEECNNMGILEDNLLNTFKDNRDGEWLFGLDKNIIIKAIQKQNKSNSKANTEYEYEIENENINDNINKNIINYMNNILNTNYRYTTDKTKKLIQARINEGFTFEDFKIVIDKKNKDWKGTEFEKFLRPETLFGTKFESYLNQKAKKKTLNDISLDELEEL